MTTTIQIEGMNELIEAVGGGGGESIVPTPTAQDEGKVLTAGDDGTASWEDAASGLPEIDNQVEVDAVLAVGFSRNPKWENDITNLIPNGAAALVPTTTSVTNGYVLTNNNGTPAWASPSGGSYPEPTSATSGQVLTADGLGSASWETPSGGGLPSTENAFGGYVIAVNQVGSDKYTGWYKPNVNEVSTGGLSGTDILTPHDENTEVLHHK